MTKGKSTNPKHDSQKNAFCKSQACKSKVKRVVIAAGGTGGHLFPAQSVAADLKARPNGCEVFFMAKGLSSNARFNSELYSFKDVASGPINLQVKTLIYSPWRIAKGILQSMRELRKFKPDVVIGFGSYHSFPVLCAARLLGISIILHEANSVPGKVNRLFSPYAAWTGVFFPDAQKHLKGKVQKTDIPLRVKFSVPFRPTRLEGLQYYGLQEGVPTVLVFGGSLGAKKLNMLAAHAICQLNKRVQVLHFTGSTVTSTAVTGTTAANQEVAKLYQDASITACVREFEPEMQYAWAASTVCISRSGASTIAEAIAFAVPAIYIPYPFATDAHQDKNAEWVANTIGGGKWFHEEKLAPSDLSVALEQVLSEPMHTTMKKALENASLAMQASNFSDLVIEYLEAKA